MVECQIFTNGGFRGCARIAEQEPSAFSYRWFRLCERVCSSCHLCGRWKNNLILTIVVLMHNLFVTVRAIVVNVLEPTTHTRQARRTDADQT